jgi:hypothetical protein
VNAAKVWPARLGVFSFLLGETGNGLGLNDEFAKLLLQGGALVLVAWLVIQTFRVTLPQLAETFREESRHQRELFEKTLKEIEAGFVKQINEMFITEIRQQRQEFREELTKQRQAFLDIITVLNGERRSLNQKLIDLAGTASHANEEAEQ